MPKSSRKPSVAKARIGVLSRACALAGIALSACNAEGRSGAGHGQAEAPPQLLATTEIAAARTATPDIASVASTPASSMVTQLDALSAKLSPCGELSCGNFKDAATAFAALLDSGPRIVAIGEAHALAGKDQVPTATEHFEKELLPLLAQRGTSELVVELLKPAPQCEKTVEKVAEQQKPVVQKQAPENKNRFVSLGYAAKQLAVTPFLLEPDCAVYQGIANAGDDAVLRMLEAIASETERRVTRFYNQQEARAQQGEVPKLVAAYGGAMHNDVTTTEEKARFTFGRSLQELSRGRYLELDLIVPEFVQSTEVWKALPWYAHFDASKVRTEATLFRVGPNSFVLIFPHTARPE
jgi:hypothetical protein